MASLRLKCISPDSSKLLFHQAEAFAGGHLEHIGPISFRAQPSPATATFRGLSEYHHAAPVVFPAPIDGVAAIPGFAADVFLRAVASVLRRRCVSLASDALAPASVEAFAAPFLVFRKVSLVLSGTSARPLNFRQFPELGAQAAAVHSDV
jgi:hypothetical protein